RLRAARHQDGIMGVSSYGIISDPERAGLPLVPCNSHLSSAETDRSICLVFGAWYPSLTARI
ncbi:MAG: hypothetical protein OXE84_12615, partial [Rhodobacteraceae bacterium]|nr:hypothetical protein [Paracoccaceae bacterium]